MRGRVEVRICGKDTKVIEIVRRSTVIPDGILELSEIVECGDLFQVDLKRKRWVRTYTHTLEEQR